MYGRWACLTTPCFGYPIIVQLAEIQSRLLDVGSAVATPADSSSQSKLARVAFPSSATAEVEVSSEARNTCSRQQHNTQCITAGSIAVKDAAQQRQEYG
jgi:hypothetical protein